MTLRQRQSLFATLIAHLIQHMNAKGYEVTFGEPGSPVRRWETNLTRLQLSASEMAEIAALKPQGRFLIVQRSDRALSDPLAVTPPLQS